MAQKTQYIFSTITFNTVNTVVLISP